MKLIGILWNSLGEKKDEATEYIKKYVDVKSYIDIDLGTKFSDFIFDMYPYNESEKYKAEYKVNGLLNKYNDNKIRILFIDATKEEKVYLKQKEKYMYKNILDLKVSLRKKFEFVIKDNNLVNGVRYDNVFHMSDDEEEYKHDIRVIMEYLKNYLIRNEGNIVLENYIDNSDNKTTNSGTRNSFWLNDYILFKENSINTFESYAEVFNYYLLKDCGFDPVYYDFATYKDKKGIITFNYKNDLEKAYSMKTIIDPNDSFTRKELIEHNNIEMLKSIINKWCIEKEYNYDERIIDYLEKVFIYDLLTLQADRNPNNYAIVVDENKNIKIKIFDNANMLFCDKNDVNTNYINYSDCEQIDKISSFLLYKSDDFCFDSKSNLFKKYYESIDEDKKQYVDYLLNKMTNENIIKIFNTIEKECSIKLPEEFKMLVLNGFSNYHDIFKEIIRETDNKKVLIKEIA